MKKVKVEEAVGMILAHDLTKILPGEFKGAAFIKGHIIKEEDIEALKDIGKNHIYVLESNEDEIHEDEAAIRIAKAAAANGLILEGPSEGKISIKASYKGLLKINLQALEEVNAIDLVMLATIHNDTVVEAGKTVAGTRIIPLSIKEEEIEKVEEICNRLGKVIAVKEIRSLKVGIVVTGSEVYEGRIQDQFGPVLKNKVEEYGGELLEMKYAPDETHSIEATIEELVEKGAEVILTSGGMSVDADDVTPTAIRNVAEEVVTYGSPVLPGAMFMLAHKGKTSILGVPACGMYHKTTVLDLVFPKVLAGEKITKKDILSLAHGGLCHNCEVCHYPICPLGK